MHLDETGRKFIQQWEGCRFSAYKDSVGVWTIGYGHTGPDVKAGLKITQDQADIFFAQDVTWAEAAVNKSVKVPLTQNQFNALVSFVYNIGTAAFAKSTLLTLLNQGKYLSVPGQLKQWTHGTGGVVINGLVNRRNSELALWSRSVENQPEKISDPLQSNQKSLTIIKEAAKQIIAAVDDLLGAGG